VPTGFTCTRWFLWNCAFAMDEVFQNCALRLGKALLNPG
jgi:hypothetical protein